MAELVQSGVRCVTLLALSDSGVPSYDQNLAQRFHNLGIPCFGCTPGLLPEFLTGALRGANLEQLAQRITRTGHHSRAL